MILPYNSGGGGSAGYPGVTSDNANGVVIEKGLTVGVPASDTDPNYIQINGSLIWTGTQGDYLDLDSTMDIVQIANMLPSPPIQPVMHIERDAIRNGHVATTPVLRIVDNLDSSGDIPLSEIILDIVGTQSGTAGSGNITTNVAGGMGLGSNVAPTDGGLSTPGGIISDSLHTVSVVTTGSAKVGTGLSAWDHTVPVAQPSITGALSAVIDANAKAVLTSIITVLVGAGFATDGTT